jgi:hypothetical protein
MDSAYFSVISPVNFAFYTRYTLEEALVLPILSILQEAKPSRMRGMEQVVHSVRRRGVLSVGLDFGLVAPVAEKHSVCFVSYPSDPAMIDVAQFLKYFSSVTANQGTAEPILISSVVYLPYKHGKSSEISTAIDHILGAVSSLNQPHIHQVRFRIMGNKTASSYAVYDAVYGYCPNSTMIVSSRHNTQFTPLFAQELLATANEQFHYYHTSYQDSLGAIVTLPKLPLPGDFSIRREPGLFESHFRHFQIFRSDLLKTSLFWVLKCAELDFYETEAPFVFIMLEQVVMKVRYINKTLVFVGERNGTWL